MASRLLSHWPVLEPSQNALARAVPVENAEDPAANHFFYVPPSFEDPRPEETGGLDWKPFGAIVELLLGAVGPNEVLNRAKTGLGLLPQVKAVQAQPFACAHLSWSAATEHARDVAGVWVEMRTTADEEARAMVRMLLRLVTQLHARAMERRQLSDAALTDPLTGLGNRRGFDDAIRQALGRAARQGESIALILLDIDHFKAVNDDLGHAEGDRALAHVAECIRSAIRPSDLASRLGGDELAILLSGADADGAIAVARRLRRTLLANPPLGSRPLTISMGIADTTALGVEEDAPMGEVQLTALADEALYAAKSAGRDQWQVHPRCRVSRLPAPA